LIDVIGGGADFARRDPAGAIGFSLAGYLITRPRAARNRPGHLLRWHRRPAPLYLPLPDKRRGFL
jgi:hypothetical protein